ncbi:probable inactive protein kinase DDB_G0270444 [Acropora muricata]|uniref:probable inactive protein kinase DDB_G0270444 n=1 Tax=Acropora muricata TaxID=159855 RepID=UPI0034E3E7C2
MAIAPAQFTSRESKMVDYELKIGLLFLLRHRNRRRLLMQRQTQRKPRKVWIRDIFTRRKTQGDYYNLVQELKLGDREFYFRYMRMSFEQLLTMLVKEILEKQDEDQNRETNVESENKEVDEDVEAGVSGEKVEDADHEVKADVVEWEAMDVDEKACERECRSECTTCSRLKNEISHLKGKITKLKYKLANNQEQWVQTFHQIQEQNRLLMVNTAVQTDPVVSEDQPTEEDLEVNEEDEEDEEANIPDFFDEDPTWDPETIDSEYEKIRNEDDSAKTYDNPR